MFLGFSRWKLICIYLLLYMFRDFYELGIVLKFGYKDYEEKVKLFFGIRKYLVVELYNIFIFFLVIEWYLVVSFYKI